MNLSRRTFVVSVASLPLFPPAPITKEHLVTLLIPGFNDLVSRGVGLITAESIIRESALPKYPVSLYRSAIDCIWCDTQTYRSIMDKGPWDTYAMWGNQTQFPWHHYPIV